MVEASSSETAEDLVAVTVRRLAGRVAVELDRAVLLVAKLAATAVLLPIALWVPGPDRWITRIWGRVPDDEAF